MQDRKPKGWAWWATFVGMTAWPIPVAFGLLLLLGNLNPGDETTAIVLAASSIFAPMIVSDVTLAIPLRYGLLWGMTAFAVQSVVVGVVGFLILLILSAVL